jgi:uncharacterized C2H2 Zn-finger protein
MPKIKSYKGRGVIIPVDEAKISTAFKCPWTDQIFGTKKGYLSHLKVLRANRMHSNIRAKIRQRKTDEFHNQSSFEAIIDWVEMNPDYFFEIALQYSNWRNIKESDRSKFWVKITYLDITYSNSVSNSHSCPKNGVTNWGGKRTLKDGTPAPNGYPGWSGRIEFQVSPDIDISGSDLFKSTGINTGSGGGVRGGKYGYSVEIFESDWPGLEKVNLFNRLKDTLENSTFKYGSPNYFRH